MGSSRGSSRRKSNLATSKSRVHKGVLYHPVSLSPIQTIELWVRHNPPAFPPKDSNSQDTPLTTHGKSYFSSQALRPRFYKQDSLKATYRHPENDSLVWEGTGRKPKWLTDLLKSGRSLDEFRVSHASGEEAPKPEGVEAKPVTGEGKDETKEVKTEWRL